MTSAATVIIIANLMSENAALRIEVGELTEVLRLVIYYRCNRADPAGWLQGE